MNWKEQLKKLEQSKEWDFAIKLMESVIEDNPDNLDAYLSMNYLLMNLLVEEKHDESKHSYYENLLKKYFNESYKKFSDNAEYLFFTGITAFMSEWFFGIDIEDAKNMLYKATQLAPDNILYKWGYYGNFDLSKFDSLRKESEIYAKQILEKNSPFRKMLEEKGSLGAHILQIMSH